MVEVMVAILILAIAIIPMVGMFDAGLRAATTGSNYDQARALANKELELARSLPYDALRTNFPVNPSTPDPTTGVIVSSPQPAPSGYPSSFSYTVRKAYARLDNSGNVQEAADASSMMTVKVTVNWGGKAYTTEGLVVK